MSTTERHGHRYTTLFCEENIWWLCQHLIDDQINPADLNVLFISNLGQQVAVFNQLSSKPGQPAIWDYHVVLLRKRKDITLVYDFDSRCDFPVELDSYLKASFLDQDLIHPDYRVLFRVVEASDYLSQFSSDRSHMQDIISNEQFPNYPVIHAATSSPVTLKQYTDFSKALFGDEQLYSCEQLLERFT